MADFECPHCSAEYSVAYEVGFSGTGSRNRDNCGKEMSAWKNSRPPVYLLKKRPAADDESPSHLDGLANIPAKPGP